MKGKYFNFLCAVVAVYTLLSTGSFHRPCLAPPGRDLQVSMIRPQNSSAKPRNILKVTHSDGTVIEYHDEAPFGSLDRAIIYSSNGTVEQCQGKSSDKYSCTPSIDTYLQGEFSEANAAFNSCLNNRNN